MEGMDKWKFIVNVSLFDTKSNQCTLHSMANTIKP